MKSTHIERIISVGTSSVASARMCIRRPHPAPVCRSGEARARRSNPRPKGLIPTKLYNMHVILSLTQQEQLDVLGRLYAILLQILLNLFAPGQCSPLLRRWSTPHLAAGSLRAKRRAGFSPNTPHEKKNDKQHPYRARTHTTRSTDGLVLTSDA